MDWRLRRWCLWFLALSNAPHIHSLALKLDTCRVINTQERSDDPCKNVAEDESCSQEGAKWLNADLARLEAGSNVNLTRRDISRSRTFLMSELKKMARSEGSLRIALLLSLKWIWNKWFASRNRRQLSETLYHVYFSSTPTVLWKRGKNHLCERNS